MARRAMGGRTLTERERVRAMLDMIRGPTPPMAPDDGPPGKDAPPRVPLARDPSQEAPSFSDDPASLYGAPSPGEEGPGDQGEGLGEGPERPTPRPERRRAPPAAAADLHMPRGGRQPSPWERFQLKNMTTDPERLRAFMAERGIDPDFDRGTTWHDPTIDMLSDYAKAVGGGVGGVLGARAGGLRGATLGAGLGAGAVSGGIGALSRLTGSPLAPAASEVGRDALIDAAATAALGAGPTSGVIARALGKAAYPLRRLVENQAGIVPAARDRLAAMTRGWEKPHTLKRLLGVEPLSTTPGAEVRPLEELSRSHLQEVAKGTAKRLRRADSQFNAAVKEMKPTSLSDLGLTRQRVGLMLRDPQARRGTEAMLRDLSQSLPKPKRVQKTLKEIAAEAGGKPPDPVKEMLERKIPASKAVQVHDYLRANREKLRPRSADQIAAGMREELVKRSPRGRLQGPWRRRAQGKRDWNAFLEMNDGEAPVLFKEGSDKGVDNLSRAAVRNYHDDLVRMGQGGTPRVNRLDDIARRNRPANMRNVPTDLGPRALEAKALALGRGESPGLAREGMSSIPYLSRLEFALPRFLDQNALPISRWMDETRFGPGAAQVGRLEDWIARRGRVPLRREAAWEAAKQPFKEAARALDRRARHK